VNSVKNKDLTKCVFAALLLVSAVVGAEDKYPASDFQPKVVYQDEDAGKQAESGAPAKSASSASSGGDSQYPAANFEPKVLYSDAEYQHTGSSPGTSASSSSASDDVSASPAAPKDESSAGFFLGLIVLAVAGYVLFKKGVGVVNSAPSAVKAPSGLTGVARYVLKTSGTGVTRYLEKNAKNAPSAAATGVAKYLASHGSSASPAGSKVATGVEKYMRNKG
jgi:hypothetical protein